MTVYADHEKYPHSLRCGTRRELKFFDTIVSNSAFSSMIFNRNPSLMIVEDDVIARVRLVLAEEQSEIT
jgi:hypothetical protein